MLNKEFLRAAQKGDLTKCLELKNNINDWSIIRHGPSGDSPLHIAAREGHLEIVRFLCENWKEQKCTTQVVNLEMKTPLHEAAQFSRTTVVDYFIEKGFNFLYFIPILLKWLKRNSKIRIKIGFLVKIKVGIFKLKLRVLSDRN